MASVQIATGFVAALFFLSGCDHSPKTPADLRGEDARAIRDLETAWNRDLSRKDVERLASRYTDDAVLLIPNAPPATGKEGIREALKQAMQDGNFSLKLENTHVEASSARDLAYSQGTYQASFTDLATNRQVQDHGSYAIVYRRQADNLWKAVVDMRTSNAPAGPP